MKRLSLAAALLLLLSLQAQGLEKWVYQSTNLLVDKNVDDLEALWKRAAAAGYTHVLLADSKFARLPDMEGTRYAKNVARVKEIAAEQKLEVVPAVFPVGYSSDLLSQDVNLIEAMPVKDLPLVVRDGRLKIDSSDAPSLPADGFADLKNWDFHDKTMVQDDRGVLHLSGSDGDFGGNARIFKKIAVQPWRQYHLSLRVKTRVFSGTPEIKALVQLEDGDLFDIQLSSLGVHHTQDWQLHHVTFNSQNFTNIQLGIGKWGKAMGDLWLSDPKIEEVAFINLVRRPGAPLELRTVDGRELVEGRDFEPLADPGLGAKPWKGEYDSYHEPPIAHTSLPDGTRVLASYYHGALVMKNQAVICLSEQKTYDLLRDQAVRMHALWGAKAYMMSHDEVRVMNHCAACQARQLTPGQLLADNVKRCAAILREVNPGGRIYIWGDMFDPHHNAVPGPYYLVNGPITGSWEGLDKDIIIVPWYLEKRAESLKFFADRGHLQVIAGYYDDDPAKVRDWLKAAQPFPQSVQAVMYTTWESNYGALEKFSEMIDLGPR